MITIIGCGWIGKPLAISLINDGQSVFGSATSMNKVDSLSELGIQSFLFDFNIKSQISTEIIEKTSVLIITIPPNKRANTEIYGNALLKMSNQFQPSTKIVFLSSSGIYPQKNGEYSEEYNFKEHEKNNSLYYAEHLLTNAFKSRLTILRLGGLIGSDRHPINHLSGKSDVKNPNGIINLVHRKDVISAIISIIKNDAFNYLFNLVSPEHPTRKNYYTEFAKKLNLAPVKFESQSSVKRYIKSKKITIDLDFKYNHSIYTLPKALPNKQ